MIHHLGILSLLISISFGWTSISAAEGLCPMRQGLVLVELRASYCQFRGEIVRKDPIDGSARTIPFLYYFSRIAPPKAPLVLVYPSLSDEIPFVETQFSKRLVRNGFHAIVVQLVEDIADLERKPTEINDFFTRSNWSTSLLIDLAESWGEISADDVNAAGVSLGGIRATIAYGKDSRLRRLIGYVTGGDLHEIIAHTLVKMIRKYREHWKAKLGLETDAAFADYLRSRLRVDPLHSASVRSGANVYFVLGRKDEKVPYSNQLKLLHAFGDPAHRIGSFGHRATGASFLSRFEEVVRALRRPVSE